MIIPRRDLVNIMIIRRVAVTFGPSDFRPKRRKTELAHAKVFLSDVFLLGTRFPLRAICFLNAMCLAQAGAQLAAVSCPLWLCGGEGRQRKGGRDREI